MKKNGIAFSVYCLFWIFLFAATKVLKSGFHFTDDHEVYIVLGNVHQDGFSHTLMAWLKHDLAIRLRPMFYFQRIVQMNLFKDKFLYYYLFNMTEAILTSYFLFLFAVKLNFNRFVAFVFPLFVLLGSQCVIWCRLGPAETPGIFLLSIALWLSSCAVFAKRSFLYELGAILFLLLASLCKESFMILILPIVVMYIWLIHEHKNIPVKDILRKKWFFISTLVLACIAELFVLFRYVGVNGIGQAPKHGEKLRYLRNAIDSLKTLFFDTNRDMRLEGSNLGFYIIIMVALLWFINAMRADKDKKTVKSFSNYLMPVFLVSSMIIGTQIIIYMKLGMHERYLIPGMLGAAFLAVYLIDKFFKVEQNKVVRFLLISFLCVTVIKSSAFSYKEYRNFAKIGMSTNQFLAGIKKYATPNDTILFVADPNANYEWSFSMAHYFTSPLNDRKNFYVYYLNGNGEDENAGDQSSLKREQYLFDNKLYERNTTLDYKVIALPIDEEAQLALTNVNLKNYVRESYDNDWIIYHKK